MYKFSTKNIDIGMESKIYIIFAFLGIVLLFYSIMEIRPVITDVESYGLASYLTKEYWIGLALVAICSIALYLDKRVKHESVYLIYLIAIGLFLYGIATFVEDNASDTWTYYPAGEGKMLLDTGSINIASDYPLISYHSWPGIHFLSAFMTYMANIGMDDIMKYMPIFWVLALILLTYSIGKLFKLPANECFMMSFLVLSSFWITYNYAPQALAYIFYLLFLVSMISLYRERDVNANIEFTFLTLLVFAATVIMHMLTSILLIIIFILLSRYISFSRFKFVSYNIKNPTDFLYRNRKKFLIFFVTIFFGWHVYVAQPMFTAGIKDLMTQILQGESFNVFKGEKYNTGTTVLRQVIHYSRISYLGLYAVSMITAVILYLKGKVKDTNKELVEMCFLWFIGILTLLVFRYGAEIDDRVYIFSILPMSLIIIMTFDKKVVSILAIIFIIVSIPAHYGTESYDAVYTTDLQGSKFMASNMNPYSSINYYNSRLIIYYKPQLITDINGTGYKQGYYNPDEASLNASEYILHSRQISNYLIYTFGVDTIENWLKKDNKSDLVYNNGYYTVYRNGLGYY